MNFIQEEKIKKRESFFSDENLEKNIKETKKISVIAVVHFIDTGIPYVNILNKYFNLVAILPKQKSINQSLLKYFPKDKILNISKKDIDEKFLKDIKNKIPKDNKIVFLDIGGYFAEIGKEFKKEFGDNFIGVIEDTENGYQKYKKQELSFPVISVARSRLKENEDYLVGQAVVFSVESLLREQGLLLNNKKIGVIGIGKIGGGILSALRVKTTQIYVYDINPINLVIAHSKGNQIETKIDIIKNSDIIFCATGNLSLRSDDFSQVKNGAFIASVTSSDDELDTSWLEENYKKVEITEYITKYEKNGHVLFLLNKGNAVNFIHGAVVDDAILLVQKEMIDSIYKFSKTNFKNKIYEGFSDIKYNVSDRWLKKILKINI